MAFADPQSVTISGTAVSLPRTGLNLKEGQFTSATRENELLIKHSVTAKRVRHVAQLKSASLVADPLVPSTMLPVGYSAHIVVDGPRQGVTNDQLQALAKALIVWLTDARLASLIGGES